jgi:hypothetical protein
MRTVFRRIVLLAVGVFTIYKIVDAIYDYRGWRGSMQIGDRSGVDLYQLNLQLDGLETLVCWGLAAAVFFYSKTKWPDR